MIKNADEYEERVRNYDRDQIQAHIDRIPMNVNRAGKHYRKLVKKIYDTYKKF